MQLISTQLILLYIFKYIKQSFSVFRPIHYFIFATIAKVSSEHSKRGNSFSILPEIKKKNMNIRNYVLFFAPESQLCISGPAWYGVQLAVNVSFLFEVANIFQPHVVEVVVLVAEAFLYGTEHRSVKTVSIFFKNCYTQNSDQSTSNKMSKQAIFQCF